MNIEFDQLPDSSRIWIYQCNRTFSEKEQTEITAALKEFIDAWGTHGTPLKAGFKTPYNRFIVIAVDQAHQAPSGCSIDASVHLIQGFEQKFDVVLMDNMNVSFKHGEFIAYKPLKDFKQMAKDKSISAKTIVFNNLVTTKAEFESNWEVPAAESWHSRFMT